ncbi:MAG: hypothetical protein ACD_68C00119G0003 [uncultured bacterium]|nr:MAG: hypothetical protein ACD_68C00119G0003 [uncultured bacterium]
MTLPIMKSKFIWLTLSGILVVTSIVLLSVFGLKLGIDFTGGSLLEIEVANSNRPETSIVKQKLEDLDFLDSAQVQPAGENGFLIRMKTLTEEEHQKVNGALSELVKTNVAEGTQNQPEIKELRFESIGPVIGKELSRRSIYAIVLVLIAIIIYLAYVFRKVSREISSWKMGAAAIIALIHDVLIVVGSFCLLGVFLNVEIDTMFITAILTVIGFSVHDTIVVLDRIRFNLLQLPDADFEETTNLSINQTLARSINTSLTAIFVLLALYLFGGESTKWFVLALIIGIFIGTYSSIFIASPILVFWRKRH